jgi:hypothetical protein
VTIGAPRVNVIQRVSPHTLVPLVAHMVGIGLEDVSGVPNQCPVAVHALPTVSVKAFIAEFVNVITSQPDDSQLPDRNHLDTPKMMRRAASSAQEST